MWRRHAGGGRRRWRDRPDDRLRSWHAPGPRSSSWTPAPTGLGASAVNAGWIVPGRGGAGAGARDGRAVAALDAAPGQPRLHPSGPGSALREVPARDVAPVQRARPARRLRGPPAAGIGHRSRCSTTTRPTASSSRCARPGPAHGVPRAREPRTPSRHPRPRPPLRPRPQVLLGDDVRGHEPQLSDRVHGGIFFPHERHLDPRALIQGLHRRLLELGVKILEHAPVAGVGTTGAGGRRAVTAAVTDAGPVDGDAFVLAAGAWTGPLSRLFGHRLPVRPGKGYSIDVRRRTRCAARSTCPTPRSRSPRYAGRLRLAGTMEFAGLDERSTRSASDAILRAPDGLLARLAATGRTARGPQAGMPPDDPRRRTRHRPARPTLTQHLRLQRPRHARRHPRPPGTRLAALTGARSSARATRPPAADPASTPHALSLRRHAFRTDRMDTRDAQDRPARHPGRRSHPVHRGRRGGRRADARGAGRPPDRGRASTAW